MENITEKQFVVFNLENEGYGIDIVKINTIERMLKITRVPNTPNYLNGVINLRGDIIPIINLRKRFGLSETEETDDTRIIIFKANEITIGLVVDMVEEVMLLREEFMEENNEEDRRENDCLVRSIGRFEDKVVTILDIDKLVSLTESDLL
jgi:purine-binding chemotaxis protein CheW